jgi:uncharacterized membrane protein
VAEPKSRFDVILFGLGISFVIGGTGMLLVALRPQTTWQEVAWVAKWAWIVAVPIFVMAMGVLGIWAAFPSREKR